MARIVRSRKPGIGTDIIPPPPGGETALRVGMMGFQDHIGEGPGGLSTNKFKVAQFNPHGILSTLEQAIDTARANDILLISYAPSSGSHYGANTAGGFNLNQYMQKLDILASRNYYNQAVEDGIIHTYAGDEPQHPKWDNSSGQATWTPLLVDRACYECKIRWPSQPIYFRVEPDQLVEGWGGFNPPPLGYRNMDYGWLQYAARDRKNNRSVQQAINLQRGFANSLNIGFGMSMNQMNAGYRTNLDGITACWDHDLSPGTPNGVLIGGPAAGAFDEGDFVPCSTLPPVTQNLMVNPALVRKVAFVSAQNSDIPFCLYWSYPSTSAGSGPLQPYYFRSDWIDAYKDAQLFGEARTQFDGFRTPKVAVFPQ